MNSVQHLELDVVDDPSVLLRVVSVCHQRRFRIASLRYEAGLTQVERLEHWLASLVHVLAVRAAESAG